MLKVALLGYGSFYRDFVARSLKETKTEEVVVVDDPADADLLLIDAEHGDLFPGPESDRKWVALVSGFGQQLINTALRAVEAGAGWAYFMPQTGPQIVQLLLDLERIFGS